MNYLVETGYKINSRSSQKNLLYLFKLTLYKLEHTNTRILVISDAFPNALLSFHLQDCSLYHFSFLSSRIDPVLEPLLQDRHGRRAPVASPTAVGGRDEQDVTAPARALHAGQRDGELAKTGRHSVERVGDGVRT